MTTHTDPNTRPAAPPLVPLLEPSLANWRLSRPGQTSPTWRLSK